MTDVYKRQNPGSAPAGDIGEARAKEAAMSHAGVAEADIRDHKIERDTDDGVGVYEIEFKAGGYEYDYEIDAARGSILKFDREQDDDDRRCLLYTSLIASTYYERGGCL